jgi:antitoxin VapB
MIDLSQETERLAVRLAATQHLSVEEAVRQALEAQARVAGVLPESHKSRDQSPAAIAERQAKVNRIVAEIAAMPILDPRSQNQIMDDLNAL